MYILPVLCVYYRYYVYINCIADICIYIAEFHELKFEILGTIINFIRKTVVELATNTASQYTLLL